LYFHLNLYRTIAVITQISARNAEGTAIYLISLAINVNGEAVFDIMISVPNIRINVSLCKGILIRLNIIVYFSI